MFPCIQKVLVQQGSSQCHFRNSRFHLFDHEATGSLTQMDASEQLTQYSKPRTCVTSLGYSVRKLQLIPPSFTTSDNHLSCLDFVPGSPLQHSTYSVHSTFAVGCCKEIPSDVGSKFLL